jgi:hypothetical protein
VEAVPAPPLPHPERGKERPPLFRTEVTSPAGKEHRFLHVLPITDRPEGTRAAPAPARWARKGDRLEATTGDGASASRGQPARRTVELRWDGSLGVVVRNGE